MAETQRNTAPGQAQPKQETIVEGKPLGQEKKLGAVTYKNPDGSARHVRFGGLLFKEGESVDLRKTLGDQKAEPLLQKLAGNPFFQVEGGPDHEQARQNMGVDPEFALAASDPVIRQEQQAAMSGQELPENYDAPLQPVLESQGARPKLPGRDR